MAVTSVGPEAYGIVHSHIIYIQVRWNYSVGPENYEIVNSHTLVYI